MYVVKTFITVKLKNDYCYHANLQLAFQRRVALKKRLNMPLSIPKCSHEMPASFFSFQNIHIRADLPSTCQDVCSSIVITFDHL